MSGLPSAELAIARNSCSSDKISHCISDQICSAWHRVSSRSSSVTPASQVLGMPSGHNVIAVEQTSFRHYVQMCTVALSSMKDFLNNTQCRKCQECQVDSNVASLFTNTTRQQQGTNNHVHNLLNNTRGMFQDHLTAS